MTDNLAHKAEDLMSVVIHASFVIHLCRKDLQEAAIMMLTALHIRHQRQRCRVALHLVTYVLSVTSRHYTFKQNDPYACMVLCTASTSTKIHVTLITCTDCAADMCCTQILRVTGSWSAGHSHSPA